MIFFISKMMFSSLLLLAFFNESFVSKEECFVYIIEIEVILLTRLVLPNAKEF